jgi:hypothetical protein
MRYLTTLFLFFIYAGLSAQQGIGINTDGSSPHSSAMLDVKSTSKGFLVPRMTAAERLAITNPATGLMVYETTSNLHWIFNGTNWGSVGNSGPQWTNNGANIFNTYTGNVGIGLNANINERLTIKGNMLVTYATSNGRANINLMGGSLSGGGSINFLKPDSSVTSSIYTNNLNNRMFIQHGDNPNQLVLNSNGRVGINNLSPTKTLDVDGSIRSRDTVSADKDIRAGQDIHANGDINAGNNIHADGNLSAVGIVTGNGLVSTSNILASGNGIVSGSIESKTSLIIDDAAAILQLKASGQNKGFVQLSGNSIRVGTNAENDLGNFIIRTNGADRLVVAPSGNVTVNGTLSVNEISTSIGDISLSPQGTEVLKVSTSNLVITNNNSLRREDQGSIDLLPLGYANISSGGTKLRGTSNVTSSRTSTGRYQINCPGVTENSIVQASINQTSGFVSNVYFIRAVPNNGYIDVFTDTQTQATVFREAMNCSFFITIYK